MRWCVCTRARVCVTEYYSALRENEIPAFATTRTDLEGLVLSETSQTEKAKYHATSLRRGIRKRENPAEQLGATVYSLVGRPYLFISVLRAAVPGVTAGKSATHSQGCRIPCLPIAYRIKLRNPTPACSGRRVGLPVKRPQMDAKPEAVSSRYGLRHKARPRSSAEGPPLWFSLPMPSTARPSVGPNDTSVPRPSPTSQRRRCSRRTLVRSSTTFWHDLFI